MRVAVISDIHGNLAALEAVLEAIEAEAPDEIWFLGDLVGYGPRPNECVALLRPKANVFLSGNHDLGVLGTIDLLEFSGDAGAAARWTSGILDPDARTFLESLEPKGEARGVGLFHGSARDPVWEYVLSDEAAATTFALTTHPVVLVGHSHVALQVALRDPLLEGGLAPAGTEVDLSGARWLLNPGSVGQPRDGDARAGWLMLDLGAQTASFRRAQYDIARTQREIREVGLPPLLAERLALGQ